MFRDNVPDAENLKIQEHIEGFGEVIFEWDRSYNVRVYPEDESFIKEFQLNSREYTALYELIDECEENPGMLE
jgi:hypothetical protein